VFALCTDCCYPSFMRYPVRLLAPLALLATAPGPAPGLAPGLWDETLVYIVDSVNGSSETASGMHGVLPSPGPHRACLDAATLADPRGLVMAGAGRSCRFSRFSMASGQIAATGDCAIGAGRTIHISGSGSYTPTGYDLSFTGTGNADGFEMAFRGRDSGRRIAACLG
jgi:hypothetical protein